MTGRPVSRLRFHRAAAALGLSLLVGGYQCAAAGATARPGLCRVGQRAPARNCTGPHLALDAGGPLGSPVSSLGDTSAGAAGLGGTLGSVSQGVGGLTTTAMTGAVLSTFGAFVSGAATFVLHETADVLNQTTTPRLDSTWFSATYWKVAGIATVLTLPFLFAASVQALVRTDITLLLRSAFGYLPLAMLAVAIAAPLTMLLLSASDELAAAVSSAAGGRSANLLAGAIASLGGAAAAGSPFVVFLVGMLTVAGALLLWVELLMREAAVYVVVLMLPLAFAAFVWPARRIWAIRSLELLAALILSKFAIVAVLSLGAAALGQSARNGVAGVLAGAVLLGLAALTPWTLLRLLPLAELASSTAGAFRAEATGMLRSVNPQELDGERLQTAAARMRKMAGEAGAARPEPRRPAPAVTEPAVETATQNEAADASAPAPPSAPAPAPTPAPAPGAQSRAAEPTLVSHISDIDELPSPPPDPEEP